MRIAIVCPEALVADANHLALALANSEADALSFLAPQWVDPDGNFYSVASWEDNADWVGASHAGLLRPDWDTDEVIDLAAVSRAKDALDCWAPTEETPGLPRPSPTRIRVLVGINGPASLLSTGLRRVSGGG